MTKVSRSLFLVFLLLLPACAGTSKPSRMMGQFGGVKTRPDPLIERRIILACPTAGEQIDVVYYRKGNYVPRAMAAINKLMRDRRANEVGEIDPELIDFLVDIRTRLALPDTVVFDILSGYRSRSTNETLAETNGAVAKDSLHLHGWAVDFRIAGVRGNAIAEIAKTMQRGGVSFYPNDNHVHVDIGNIRTWGKSRL